MKKARLIFVIAWIGFIVAIVLLSISELKGPEPAKSFLYDRAEIYYK